MKKWDRESCFFSFFFLRYINEIQLAKLGWINYVYFPKELLSYCAVFIFSFVFALLLDFDSG
jgi:hypothetical protein